MSDGLTPIIDHNQPLFFELLIGGAVQGGYTGV